MKWQGPPLIAALLLATGASAGEAPTLKGVRQVSELGLVDFITDRSGHITGRYRGGGVCAFKVDEVIIDGELDGTLFVGMVTLCQAGAGCPKTERYPFLGVFSDADMVGHVKVNEGCASPAITGGKLEVVEADVEAKQKILGADSVSASDIANRGDNKAGDQLEEEINRHFTSAQAALEAGDYGRAKAGFQLVITAKGTHSPAYLGLGVAQLHQKDANGALRSIDRALQHARSMQMSSEYVALVQYNRACALAHLDRKKEAIDALKLALRDGPKQFADEASREPEFDNLRRDRAFKQVLDDAKSRHARNNR